MDPVPQGLNLFLILELKYDRCRLYHQHLLLSLHNLNFHKTISFTHNPTTNGKENMRLKYNIEVGSDEPYYGVPYSSPRRTSEFKMLSVGKRYRIHSDDKLKIQLLRKV